MNKSFFELLLPSIFFLQSTTPMTPTTTATNFLPDQLPHKMKAAQVQSYGEVIDGNLLAVSSSVSVPRLDDPYEAEEPIHPMMVSAAKEDRKTHMIIKTLAVALAPGDCRVMSGKTRRFQGPPSFPYIPGGDCCGVVMETMPDEKYFQKGDVVAARFTTAPRDAIAEYARVSTTVCEKVKNTTKISPLAAAALASASPAVCVSDHIRSGERVLVIGASGGIGSHVVQLARTGEQKASYICGVSRNPDRLLQKPLNCDDAVDYNKENILESVKYQKEPFDIIIDLSASGTWLRMAENARKQNQQPPIVKPASQGGRYITLTPDAPTIEAKSLLEILRLFLFQPLGRYLWYNRFNIFTRNSLPAFIKANGLPSQRDIITRTLTLAQDGKLQAVIEGPYPMTTDGVCEAFRSVQSRHSKGKVVVQVAELPK